MKDKKFLDALNTFKNTFRSIDWRFVSVKLNNEIFCVHSVIRFSSLAVNKIKEVHENLVKALGRKEFDGISINLIVLPFNKWAEVERELSTGMISINGTQFKLLKPIEFDKLHESNLILDDYEKEWKRIDFFLDLQNDNIKKINNFLREFDTTLFGYDSIEEMTKSWLHGEVMHFTSRFIFSIPIYAKILDCELDKEDAIKVTVKAHKNLGDLFLQVKTFKKYSIISEKKELPVKRVIKTAKNFVQIPLSLKMDSITPGLKTKAPDMTIQVSLIHKKYGIIDNYYGKFSLSFLISKKYGQKLPPFLSTFQKFCSEEDYKDSLFKTTDKDRFEWGVINLFSLANIPAIWLKNHDVLRVNGTSIGGVDGIAYIEYYEHPTLLLIGCTSGVIKDDIEKIFNIKKTLLAHLRIENIEILPIVISQKTPSRGMQKLAKESNVAILGPDELSAILQDIKRGESSHAVLNKIYKISRKEERWGL
jgi:hypothetical protein